MSLSAEDLRFAADDARRYLQSQVDLMHANDRQAIALLQLFVALAVATLSGSAAILLGTGPALPRPLGFGLGMFGTQIALAAVCCFVVLWPADWRLPGREPEFWDWAEDHQRRPEDLLRTYLRGVKTSAALNAAVTRRVSRFMLAGKFLGSTAPLVGLGVGLLSWSYAL